MVLHLPCYGLDRQAEANKEKLLCSPADALAYEREYLAKSSRTTNMKFGSMVELYMADAKTRLRPTTYEMKQWDL